MPPRGSLRVAATIHEAWQAQGKFWISYPTDRFQWKRILERCMLTRDSISRPQRKINSQIKLSIFYKCRIIFYRWQKYCNKTNDVHSCLFVWGFTPHPKFQCWLWGPFLFSALFGGVLLNLEIGVWGIYRIWRLVKMLQSFSACCNRWSFVLFSIFCIMCLMSITSRHEDRIWKRKNITRRYAHFKFWNLKVVLPSSCQHVSFGQDVVFCFAVFCFHRGFTFCQVGSWLLICHWRNLGHNFYFGGGARQHSRPPHLLLRPSVTPFALFGRTIPLDVNCRISNHTFGQQLQNNYITST